MGQNTKHKPNKMATARVMTVKNMATKAKTKREKRVQRHERQRRNINGTSDKPRLAVFRSNSHIYAQVINDAENEGKGHTLCAASMLTPKIREQLDSGANKEAAKLVGAEIAEKCKSLNITQVVFDKGGFLYHGRVEAVADAAREGGLQF